MKLHLAIGVYFVLWLLLMGVAAAIQGSFASGLWIIVGAGIGMLSRSGIFLYQYFIFAGKKQEDQFLLGTIYAADLLGSCLGALGVSVFMIPVYGVYKTLLFLMIINFTLAVVLFIIR